MWGKPIILSILSAAMLCCGWLGLTGLPLLLAFTPLLIISHQAVEGCRGWWETAGWVTLSLGLWSGVTTWWIWYAAPLGAILSVVITILLFGGVFMTYHWVSKRTSGPISFLILICGWIAAEYLYTVGEISFPWLVLGNGFANDTWAVQWYSITGVFGGSLWALLSSVIAYSLWQRRTAAKLFALGAVLFLPLVVSLTMFYTFDSSGGEVKVSVVQPNIDPYNAKFSSSRQEQDQEILSLAAQSPQDVDLIVAPETALDWVYENDLEGDQSLGVYRQFMQHNYPDANMIVGASTVRYYYPGDNISFTARTNDMGNFYDHYNTAILVDSSYHSAVHHKSKLAPGVEKMPYYRLTKHLEFLIVDLGGISGELGTDPQRTVFTTRKGTPVATAICYESIYGGYYAEFARNGAQLMTIITNDGWWRDTPGYRQHFSFARLRAIESRRDIARSANTGISGFINGRGDVLQKSEWWTPAVLSQTLNSREELTFYVLYGDYIGRLCSYVFVLSLLYYIAYHFRRRNHLVK